MRAPGSREETWTIRRLLGWTQGHFADVGLENPRLDAEVLLAAALGVERIYLYTHFDRPVNEQERSRFRSFVQRRARLRQPVAQIVGVREFYGRPFKVTPDVLVPRPETEHLIEAALAWLAEHGLNAPRILDLGAGSGAISVTLAAELPRARVVATDISAPALEIARENAAALGVADRVELRAGDLFGPVEGDRFDVVVSNPPYVEAAADLPVEVREHEPAVALFAGEDGLAVIRALVSGVEAHLDQPGFLAIEVGAAQGRAVAALFEKTDLFSSRGVRKDLAGHVRVITGER